MEELYDQLESTKLHVSVGTCSTHACTHACACKLATLNLVSYVNLATHQIYHLAVLDGNAIILLIASAVNDYCMLIAIILLKSFDRFW